MYFRKFPLLAYTLDDGASYQYIPDILRRVKLSEEVKRNKSFFDKYDVMDGETPEIVADKFYGDSTLHWIILLSNEIIDPRLDWVMDFNTLVNYVKGKYGDDRVSSVHHYTNPAGYRIGGYRGVREDSTINNPLPIILETTDGIESSILLENAPAPGELIAVTNLDYEDAINEGKRRINILKPGAISEIDELFTKLVNE